MQPLTAARPIRINRGDVDRVLDLIFRRLENKARRHGSKEKVGTHRNPFLSVEMTLRNVMGEDLTVMVALISSPGGVGIVKGGAFGHFKRGPQKGQPIVILEINGSYTWGLLANQSAALPEMRSVLMHELTHAADTKALVPGEVQGRIPSAEEIDYTAYINDPKEVRAHMREIFEDLRPMVLRVRDTKLYSEWGLGGTVQRFLRSNNTWKQIEPHLTRRSRNTILKGIITAFEDEGFPHRTGGFMPKGVVKTKRDEEKWDKAKEIAEAAGQKENWPYIMGIYKQMKPDYEFQSKAAYRSVLSLLSDYPEHEDHISRVARTILDFEGGSQTPPARDGFGQLLEKYDAGESEELWKSLVTR